jgi:hypothetical protein
VSIAEELEEATVPGRRLIAVSPPVADRLQLVAAEAVVAAGGHTRISQRTVADTLLRRALADLGEEAAEYVLSRMPHRAMVGWMEEV